MTMRDDAPIARPGTARFARSSADACGTDSGTDSGIDSGIGSGSSPGNDPGIDLGETIFALATGQGRAGIAVVRISGRQAEAVLSQLTHAPLPLARQAVRRDLYAASGGLIDQCLVLRFGAGASYTGEPVVEFHCHGGRAVIAAILEELGRQPGCRLAEPGEFTRRAFEAGRLDLTRVEALGDLLAAETEMQRRQAILGASGELYRQAEAWRSALIRAAALVEVTIDWADEEVPEDVGPEVAELIAGVRTGMLRTLRQSAGADRLREGFEVAILGAPNSGKSSLFNTFAGREAAITSALPGTTRDVLELPYDLGGLPVVFLDTAGLRESSDEIEACGVARALTRAGAASMRIFLRAADAPPWEAEETLYRAGDLRVWAKSDLGRGAGDLMVSALRGDGVAELLEAVRAELLGRVPTEGLVSHLRQRRALEDAGEALARAVNAIDGGEAETVAEDLRTAFRALERLIGWVGVEDVLDAVFGSFCLGK